MLGVILPMLAQAAVEPPRTVNEIELGDAGDFATAGPATVCMREMVIAPQPGETAYLTYSGIHNGGIRLVLSNGEYIDFTYGEIFRDQRKSGQRTSLRAEGMRVYRYDDDRGPDVDYQVHADLPATDWSDGGWQPLVNVSGTALSGNRNDAHLLERLSFNLDVEAACNRRYNFGWGVILEGEPIDETKVQ
jgi:hypothetical protein